MAGRAPAVTRCSAPCWRPSYRASHRLEGVDLVGGLVGSQGGDPREAQREPRLVAVRADDHVERDLDDDLRLDLAVAPVARDRVRLEPLRHLGDLGVGQPAVRLADRDQPLALGVADRERVVGQDAVALAVADLDADHDAVDRRQGLLHLQPAEAAPAGRVAAVGVLDHEALVAPGARLGERGLERVDVGRRDQVGAGEPAAVRRRAAARAPRAGDAARSAAAAAAARPARRRPVRAPSTSKATKITGTSARIASRRRLAPEPRLERDERQHDAVLPGEDLAVEDAVPRQVYGRLGHLRELAA